MNFVVIDTETTWKDEVMSIGAVIAYGHDFSVVDSRYYLIDPQYKQGGIFSKQLHLPGPPQEIIGSRDKVVVSMKKWLKKTFCRNYLCLQRKIRQNTSS